MSEQLSLTAHARTSDPWTSREAARSISPDKLRASQRAVLECFKSYGRPMHHAALVRAYRPLAIAEDAPWQSESGLRTRTKELVALGMLKDTGQTVTLESGRKSIVWGVSA